MSDTGRSSEDGSGAGKRACWVWCVDSSNAVCLQHNPECKLVAPYGNYCEHPSVYQLPRFKPPSLAVFDPGRDNP